MKILVLISVLLLSACYGGPEVDDLEVFVADTTAKPRGRIKPLPEFQPYSTFIYGASALRSPFESPVVFEEMATRYATQADAPDNLRHKQPLERHSLGELSLVGTLSKEGDDGLKALIKTASGNVHVVTVGQYMGKNNGRVLNILDSQLDLIEVVPNGSGGWISRPHSMGMKDSAGGEK
ncbi:MAG: pilus assembly protein PilP [Bermanella sp.]